MNQANSSSEFIKKRGKADEGRWRTRCWMRQWKRWCWTREADADRRDQGDQRPRQIWVRGCNTIDTGKPGYHVRDDTMGELLQE